MIGYSIKKRKYYWENAFEQKKKKPGLKFNPGLALIGPRTDWPDFSITDKHDSKLADCI